MERAALATDVTAEVAGVVGGEVVMEPYQKLGPPCA